MNKSPHPTQHGTPPLVTSPPFDYSDGDAIETRLLTLLQNCRDVSCASMELRQHMTDWPSLYHLSPARHNLLRPFRFSPGDRILELGSGCGAMTRFMGESGSEVVAVEGSTRRAKITAERCRDLSNVRVICEDIMHFSTDQRFDFVTLIGVLEYAPRYIPAEDPILACLKQARSFLKPEGVLVLAIENQLGLKYFNGCDEDHLGKPYYGLHGLYRKDEPTTHGRAAIEAKLVAAGMPYIQFYYPFPDYKLPQVILSDAALSASGFDAAALLAGMVSGNAGGELHPNFHENLAWRPIIDNGLLPHLSNSFLILAGATEEAFIKFEKDWLACAYATSRIPVYATETRFTCVDNNVLVKKQRLHPDCLAPEIDLPNSSILHQINTVSNYIVGQPYLLELQQRLGRGEGIAGVVEWAMPWLDLLLAHSFEGENGAALPGDWIDAIPQNFIRDPDGKLQRIDDEWKVSGPVPLGLLLVRGLVNSIGLSPTSIGLRGMEIKLLIETVATSRGIDMSQITFDIFLENETTLLSVVYGRDARESRQNLAFALGQYPACPMIPVLSQDHHNHVEAELTGEIARVKSTASWQITKPLRGVWNVLFYPILSHLRGTK
ncbi:MAG: class I SAM-dependent methyltransferase [Rhodoferax sp.]|nr:class I SAM-dependent methyltransferase [Rhodoferax sp.]